MDLQEFAREQAQTLAPLLEQLNRSLWDFAEFGYQEFRSSKEIARVLEEEGFQVELGVGGIPTAIRASYGQGHPVIGILGEYDALPNLSQKAGCPRQEPIPDKDCGHGCGHNSLGAGAVGAAMVAKRYLQQSKKPGTICFLGCPAEETGFGKAFLAREGCFADLDAALTWNPSNANKAAAVKTVAYYKVRFDFTGRTAHAGACPELGRSALDACELMNVGVNYLREHIISQARVHYAYLDCGGSAPNVVQEKSSLLYFVRAPKLTQCAEILERIKKIAQGAALMTETQVKISVSGGLSDMIPNQTLAEVLSESLVQQGGPDFTQQDYELAQSFLEAIPKPIRKEWVQKAADAAGEPLSEFEKHPLDRSVAPFDPALMNLVVIGSSDVGDVSHIVPTAQVTLTATVPGTSPHTWQFTAQVGTSLGGRASVAAAKVLGLACEKLFDDPALVQKAKEELARRCPEGYQCPIPEGMDYASVNP